MKIIHTLSLIIGASLFGNLAHAQFSVALRTPANGAVVDCNRQIAVSGTYASPHQNVSVLINDQAATRPTTTSFQYNLAQLFGRRTITAKLMDLSVTPNVVRAQQSITIACASDIAPFSLNIQAPTDGATVDCNKQIPVTGGYTSPHQNILIRVNGQTATRPGTTSYTYSLAQLFGRRTITAELVDLSVTPNVVRAQKAITIACASDAVPYTVTIQSPADGATVDCSKQIPVTGAYSAPNQSVAVRVNGQTATRSSATAYHFSLAQLMGRRTITAEVLDTAVSPAVVKAQKAITIACASDAPATPTDPYTINRTTREIRIWPQNGDPMRSVNEVVSFLRTRPDQLNLWTVFFGPGEYPIKQTINMDELMNVNLLSDATKPAILRKDPASTTLEYAVSCIYCDHVKFDGFRFMGSTPVYNPDAYSSPSNPVWRDQGIFLASTDTCTVSHSSFYNFGNTAIRTTTYFGDPTTGTDSFNNIVEDNYFENIQQLSTTADNTIEHGGTSTYVVRRNTFKDLRGAVKFATRVESSEGLYVRDNVILSGSHFGIEISGYTDKVEVTGNRISNMAEYGIVFYTNDRVKRGTEFEWGNNYVIRGNTITGAGGGIAFDNAPYTGYGDYDANGNIFFANYAPSQYIQFDSHNLTIDANTFRAITGRVFNFKNLLDTVLTTNKIYDYRGTEMAYFNPDTTFRVNSGNTVNDQPVDLTQ
jgi:hypothetical protein